VIFGVRAANNGFKMATCQPLQGHVVAMPDDQARFLALLKDHKKILYKVAYVYCRNSDDRRDLIQEMLIQLWQAFGRYDGRSRFSTWSYRVAVNVAISFYRRERRRSRDTVSLEDFGLDVSAADEVFDEKSDNMRALRKLIGQMDEMNRALIVLFLDGFSYEEIAGIVGTSVTNVGTRLNRIKQKLQRDFAVA
jgi:RNA polymerase sigma factor (sigma-70 family)